MEGNSQKSLPASQREGRALSGRQKMIRTFPPHHVLSFKGRGLTNVNGLGIPSPSTGEGVKKLIWFFLASFRRKPESSVFNSLGTYWTPVFTGVTTKNQFFHTFGKGRVGVMFLKSLW
jgi:hypothetical protein